MNYNEETKVLEILDYLKRTTKENNKLLKENNRLLISNNHMLKQIINFINENIINHNKENNEDFVRNILANMISTRLELFGNRK